MIRPIYLLFTVAALAVCLSGCDNFVGRPKSGTEIGRPQDQLEFTSLYKTNCAACHGENGKNGAAVDLANPEYQSLVDDESLKKWITTGLSGTEMPAFGTASGGSLTNEQIHALIEGMRENWAQPTTPSTQSLETTEAGGRPAYLQTTPGDVEQCHRLYASDCSSCHRPSRQQITDPAYLALVSDQALRTMLIAGRPDIGHPGWRMDGATAPLSSQGVTDIVTYLRSLRNETPGQPYPQHP